MLAKMNSTNGFFTIGTYQDKFLLQYTNNDTVEAETNGVTKSISLLNESGNSVFSGDISAATFNGYSLAAAAARGVYTLTTKSHLNYGSNNTYLVDKAGLSFWNGAYSSRNASNLTYCANGTIVGTSGSQTIDGVKTFSSAPKISATLSSSLNDTTIATTAWVKSIVNNTSGSVFSAMYMFYIDNAQVSSRVFGIKFSQNDDFFYVTGGLYEESGGNDHIILGGYLRASSDNSYGSDYEGSIYTFNGGAGWNEGNVEDHYIYATYIEEIA